MLSAASQSVWLIPGYSLFGAIASLLWSPGLIRLTGPRPSGYVNVIASGVAFLHSLLALWAMQPAQGSFRWLNTVGFELSFDWSSTTAALVALTVITGLTWFSQIYAIGYLERDWGWARFFGYLSLFEAGLSGLVLCDSLFFSYVILEMLTLGTYLIVGYWYNQPLVLTGARDAFLTKRIGDLILLVGVLGLLPLAGTWNFDQLAEWASTAEPSLALTAIAIALIAGPLGKCAQFPFHLWLDEAMEGPLPSTILRNAIVVVSGAWVLIRIQPIIAAVPVAETLLISVGVVTAICASLIAIAQVDVKRALSYLVSTWMGLVFIAVGAGQTIAAERLLLVYSLSMALLMMSVGTIVIRNISQDITQLGGLWSRRPLPALAFALGGLSLLAMPPFGGFWAWLGLAEGLWPVSPWLVIVLVFVLAAVGFGLARIFARIWGGPSKAMSVRSAEVLWLMVLPMLVLAGLTLHLPILLAQAGLLPQLNNLAIPLVWASLVGVATGTVVYYGPARNQPVQLPWQGLQNFFAQDFYTPILYRRTIVASVSFVATVLQFLDRTIVDGTATLMGLITLGSGQGLRYNVSGRTQGYALTMLLAIAVGSVFFLMPFLRQSSVLGLL
ncbi:NAD(P)H-quinone oxidoreductase subunit F [Synechococcus elongatus]|uniref:NAD(P)H-quinone oxidoreductase subunit F n=1 Tax=Synechococcus elongatus TaxID=32046 RepID=UPI000F7E8EF0|nr:NAD(P)H-quinone oxidoreductase subunit F [Synechococcus elongatus]